MIIVQKTQLPTTMTVNILSFLNLSLIPKGQATKTKNIMPKLSGLRSV